MARIALSILWGGALCGLGCLAIIATATSRDADPGFACFVFLVFLAAILFTLGAADVFNLIDFVSRRGK